jgi:N-acyl-D-aspartate/D-glutamate deacylase
MAMINGLFAPPVWALVFLPAHVAAQATSSFLIRGARVVDGSGAPARRADVRVVEGRIAEGGQLTAHRSEPVVEALEQVLASGFIDNHSHHEVYDSAHTTGHRPGKVLRRN